MKTLFDNGPAKGRGDDNLDPRDWYVVKEVRPGVWVIRNLTKKQNLLGEYTKKATAEDIRNGLMRKKRRRNGNDKHRMDGEVMEPGCGLFSS